MISRILDLAGGDDPQGRGSKIRSFRIILMMAVCAETLMDAVSSAAAALGLAVQFLVAGLVLGGCLAVVWLRRWERAATLVVVLVLAYIYALRFPDTANHHFLAFVCMLLLWFFDSGREEERALLLQGLRWVTVIMFFYTGFQKLLYGLYFQGEYFAYFIASKTRFAEFFQYVLPQQELARLQELGPAAPWSGPYRIHWLPIVIASNAVMAGEMLLPILLLIRKTRSLALAASLLLILAIELGAREFIFGSIFVSLVLLFARQDLNRKLLALFAVLFGALVALRLVAPDWGFA